MRYRQITSEKWDRGFEFYRSYHSFTVDYYDYYLSKIYRLSIKNPIKRFFLRSLKSRFAITNFIGGLFKPDSRRRMLSSVYVELNRKKCYYITADIDIKIDDIKKFIDTISISIPPTIIVLNRRTKHCHLIYELDKPYSFSSQDQKFSLSKAFRDFVNESIGGDKRYNGCTVRNPLNIIEHDIYYTNKVYTWDEIFNITSFSILKEDLSKPSVKRPVIEIKAPVFYPRLNFIVKEGRRNITLFDYGRKFAYGIARVSKSESWLHKKVRDYLNYLNEVFCKPPLPSSEIETIARSISTWVWERLGYFLSVKYKKQIPLDIHELRSRQRTSALETTKKKLLKAKKELYKKFIEFYNSTPFSKHSEIGRRLIKVRNFVKNNKLVKFKSKTKNMERDSIIRNLKEIFGFKTNSKMYRYLKFIIRLIKRFFIDIKYSSYLLNDSDNIDMVFTFKRRLLLSDLDYAPLDKFKSRFWLSKFSISIDGIPSFPDFDYWYSNLKYLS